jgi:integrase
VALGVGRIVEHDLFEAGGQVRTAKTGARARFTVTADLRSVLDAARALQGDVPSVYVLAHRGRPLNRYTLSEWFHDTAKAAGIVDVRFHDIRAKAATDADAQGQDATALLGHKSAQTTAVYLRGRKIVEIEPVRRRKM